LFVCAFVLLQNCLVDSNRSLVGSPLFGCLLVGVAALVCCQIGVLVLVCLVVLFVWFTFVCLRVAKLVGWFGLLSLFVSGWFGLAICVRAVRACLFVS